MDGHNGKFHQAWIVTNTKFTSNAIRYAQCAGIGLIGWSYPHNDNLASLVDKYCLHPITALSLINKNKKEF